MRSHKGMQRVQTAKSNMLLNLNLRDVLLRVGGARTPSLLSFCARRLARALALASSMHWKCDSRVLTDRQTWTLLRVACWATTYVLLLIAESVCSASFCIYVRSSLQHQQVKSEVEIFLRFDGVPEPALSFVRTCSQPSVFFRVRPLSVRGLTFTCMRGSVIFSNMLDFADYVWTTCVACPLAAFGGSISPWFYTMQTTWLLELMPAIVFLRLLLAYLLRKSDKP